MLLELFLENTICHSSYHMFESLGDPWLPLILISVQWDMLYFIYSYSLNMITTHSSFLIILESFFFSWDQWSWALNYQRSLVWLMDILRRAGIFLDMRNLPNSKETGCSISCPQLLPFPHILENFEGYREVALLCFGGFKGGESLSFPISGTFANKRTRNYSLKCNVYLSCFILSPLNASFIH